MSWIQKLFETYEQTKGREPPSAEPLLPISHTLQQAHIEITLDTDGNFKGAVIVEKVETVIPATEKSAGRTGKTPPPHPLCDKVQYCAADYPTHGGEKPSFFKEYEELLSTWCDSEFSHSKAKTVLAYARKHNLVADLIKEKILHVDASGKLLKRWSGESPSPAIFRLLTAKDGERDQGDAFIQLAAQAMCLEEMLGVTVPLGAIYHASSRRRREVAITPELRGVVEATVNAVRQMIEQRVLPPPVNDERCRACSLIDACQPAALADVTRLKRMHDELLTPDT